MKLGVIVTFLIALVAPTPAFAEAEATVETRYSTLDAGPIAGHVMSLGLSVGTKLGEEIRLSLAMPVVVSVVEEFSCCDVAAGNARGDVQWNRKTGWATLGASAAATLPTALGRSKIVPALRLARRIEAARDADAYSLDVLSLSAEGSLALRHAGVDVRFAGGPRQRFSLGEEHATETHAIVKVQARATKNTTELELNWGGAVPIAGPQPTFAHGASASASRSIGQFWVRAEVYLPLDSELLEQSTFSLGLSLGNVF